MELSTGLTAGSCDVEDNNKDYASAQLDWDVPAPTAEKTRYHVWPFPIDMCRCMPTPMKFFIPRTWRVIQDWMHLAALGGALGGIMLLCQATFNILSFEDRCSRFCFVEGLSVWAVVPTFAYICKLVSTYDEQMQVKKKQVAEVKKEVTETYESMMHSMDDLLSKAAESSATIAERSFESKRRHFMRFLDRARLRYSQFATANEGEREMMLQHFRRFVKCWLGVFQECSVDPVRKPKLVVSNEELEECTTVDRVATLALERLKLTEVRFISTQHEYDSKLLRGLRVQHCQAQQASLAPPVTENAPRAGQPMDEIELTTMRSPRPTTPSPRPSMDAQTGAGGSGRPDFLEEIASVRTNTPAAAEAVHSELPQRCSWVKVRTQGTYGCGRSRMLGSSSPYPKVCQCHCMELVVLSGNHGLLLIGFVIGVATLLVRVFPVNVLALATHDIAYLMMPICIYIACVATLLARFEEIDAIQRMECEIKDLKSHAERVAQRRQHMIAFWGGMQSLTDIWANRTMPRLDLLMEVHGHLESCHPADDLAFLAAASTRFEELEARLPEINAWRGGESGALSEALQKAFAEQVQEICREGDLRRMIHQLSWTIDNLPPLEAGA
eukprot:CAMPEP_0117511182 /NCGR_PEP_ID=MMETSP0784-20121206/28375_1 /TAXON_ID=39447 /ORGANISM="" /LENGTH=611 /DNA_ID=CAMNT_0005306845 /DNA_START=37 /DNA_END=1868 /DNA_ORIENTATION=+